MLRICRLFVLGLLPLWLAGCQSPSPKAITADIPMVNVPEPLTVALAAPISESVQPLTSQRDVPTLPTNSPPPQVVHSWPTNWTNVWIPLETWGRYNGMARMTQHGSNQSPAYELQTSNAVMSVKMGSKVARCNGLECW